MKKFINLMINEIKFDYYSFYNKFIEEKCF